MGSIELVNTQILKIPRDRNEVRSKSSYYLCFRLRYVSIVASLLDRTFVVAIVTWNGSAG